MAATSNPPTWSALAVSLAGLLISCLALVATILFFRRLNTRQGKLVSFRPYSFGLQPPGEAITIVLPLVFYNDGALPIVIQDIRLTIGKTPMLFRRQRREDKRYLVEHADQFPEGSVLESEIRPDDVTLAWKGFRNSVTADASTTQPTVFAVPGRTTETRFVEFGKFGSYDRPRRGEQAATVKIKVAHRRRWLTLVAFDFHIPMATLNQKYSVYSNVDEFQIED